jgi:hypothetical protein
MRMNGELIDFAPPPVRLHIDETFQIRQILLSRNKTITS